MTYLHVALLGLGLFCLQARAAVYPTSFNDTTWDDDAWSLTTTAADPGHYQSRASLSNGYIGINLASLGPFFEVDTPVNGDNILGWPLFDRRQTFATISGFYGNLAGFKAGMTNFEWLNELGDESVISGIPHWAGLEVEYEGSYLDASTNMNEISAFSSTWNFRNATMEWQYTWTPATGPSLNVSYVMFLHKLYINQAFISMTITSSEAAKVSVYDVLNGDCAVRTESAATGYEAENGTIWSSVRPINIPNVTAYTYSKSVVEGATNYTRSAAPSTPHIGSNSSSIAQTLDLNLQPGKSVTITKYVGIASGDAFEDPAATARNASVNAATAGFAASLKSHTYEWQTHFTTNSVDSYHLPNGSLPNDQYIIDQQIMSVTNPYGIFQNTVGTNAVAAADDNDNLDSGSVAVCGLGASCYAGLIFWDAENWMASGIVVAHPQAAKQIANYRVAKFHQAQLNVNTAYLSSQANTSFAASSAIFPWTSGRYGNCTGTGPCFDYEYHINGDIGLELENIYYVTGNTAQFKDNYFPVYDAIAQLYSDLLFYNTTTGMYSLSNATDPDEYANHIDNPAYTMVLIRQILENGNSFRTQFGLNPSATWARQASNIDVPTDTDIGIFLEYSGMNGSIDVKQADVVLIDDFLNNDNPYTLANLDYYAGKQDLNGPGMTFGVFSIVAAEETPSGCSSYTYDLYGSTPYARGPWYQYSEQINDDFTTNGGTHPSFPFLTGMGGANRVAIFGYLGLRLRQDSLNISPSLPPQIPNLRYRTIYWQGHAVNAYANQTHTTLNRMRLAFPGANTTYFNTSIPVTLAYASKILQLSFDQSLVIPNRIPANNYTVPGNVAQCQPVTSDSTYIAGQFPLAAVDGAVSTSWQPDHSGPASITVNLGTNGWVPITGFAFDFAAAPPVSVRVSFSNVSNPTPAEERVALPGLNITISDPYDAVLAAQLTPYMSNTTNVTLVGSVYGGSFATLTIEGSLAGNGMGHGASVAEWAIVKEGEGFEAGMRRYHEWHR